MIDLEDELRAILLTRLQTRTLSENHTRRMVVISESAFPRKNKRYTQKYATHLHDGYNDLPRG